MEEKDVIYQIPDKEEIGLITSAQPEEVNLPGYEVKTVKQFDSLYFLWLKRN